MCTARQKFPVCNHTCVTSIPVKKKTMTNTPETCFAFPTSSYLPARRPTMLTPKTLLLHFV